jgi:ubiquinone biosynthesis protein UbiJ
MKRPSSVCSLYWKNRVLACFQERDIAKREELLDRAWWDAAEELTPLTNPLSAGALATYAVRLEIALKRDKISQNRGNAVFDRLTEETRL